MSPLRKSISSLYYSETLNLGKFGQLKPNWLLGVQTENISGVIINLCMWRQVKGEMLSRKTICRDFPLALLALPSQATAFCFVFPVPVQLFRATSERDYLWSRGKAHLAGLQAHCSDILPTTANWRRPPFYPSNVFFRLKSCLCRRPERNMFLKVSLCSAPSTFETSN